jgi:hypothetical protein
MSPSPLRRGLAAALVPALLIAPLPAAAQESAKKDAPPATAVTAEGRSTIVFWIRDEQGKDAVGLRFFVTPMEGKASPLSAPATDRFGESRLGKLSYGYYRYGVETPAGIYLGNRILLVPPEQEVAIEIDLSPFLPEDDKLGVSRTEPVPGTDKTPVGVARLHEETGPRGLAWFQTGKGVAVIVGAGVLLVGAVIALTDSGNTETSSASPSTPSRR